MKSSDDGAAVRRRILYLITTDISARFLRGQLGYLIGQGFDVHVGVRQSSPPAAFDEGVTVHDLPYEREPNPISDARALVATVRLMRAVRPDIVNASTPKAGLLGMLAARVLRVPRRVYAVRGLRFETLTGLRRLVFRAIERLTTACATDVIFNSRSLMRVAELEHVVRTGQGMVLAGGSGNGIDVDRLTALPSKGAARKALGIPAEDKVIGFVGRLTRDKGIVDLIEAFNSIDNATLLLVGDFEVGDPVPEPTRRTVEESLRIVHLPWTDDVRQIYAAIDVLAFPSYREGLPNVPLEAQLCGIPVVAYASTGTVDAVSPAEPNRLIDVGDISALEGALTHLTQGRVAPVSPVTMYWVRENFCQQRIWGQLTGMYGSAAR